MATRTISTKLAIEGEAQYRQALSSCNAELKTLKSSLALAESEYKNDRRTSRCVGLGKFACFSKRFMPRFKLHFRSFIGRFTK